MVSLLDAVGPGASRPMVRRRRHPCRAGGPGVRPIAGGPARRRAARLTGPLLRATIALPVDPNPATRRPSMASAPLPPLLSSDGHLEVLPERWSVRVPARFKDKVPRTIKLPDGGDAILVPGAEPRPVPFLDLRAGRTNETWQPFGVTVEDTAGVGPPEQRLREQDMDGLGAEVLFPNMQMGPRLWALMTDVDAYRAAVRAYNDWLGEEYCAVSRDRLIGLGVIPWTTVDDAVAELEHCARLGLRGVNLGVFPSGKGYPTPEDDRFWAAAIDMRMPLTVHVAYDRLGPRAKQPTFEYPGADEKVLSRLGG